MVVERWVWGALFFRKTLLAFLNFLVCSFLLFGKTLRRSRVVLKRITMLFGVASRHSLTWLTCKLHLIFIFFKYIFLGWGDAKHSLAHLNLFFHNPLALLAVHPHLIGGKHRHLLTLNTFPFKVGIHPPTSTDRRFSSLLVCSG